jgi:hypothetical protein
VLGVSGGAGRCSGHRAASANGKKTEATRETRVGRFGCFFSTKVPQMGRIFSFGEPLCSTPFEPNKIKIEYSRFIPRNS